MTWEEEDPLDKTAKWMRELPQNVKAQAYDKGDDKVVLQKDQNIEIINLPNGGRYKRIRLFNEYETVHPSVSPYIRRWGYIDMRGWDSFTIFLQNIGANWINYCIEATMNPDRPDEKGSDDWTDSHRAGWFLLRKMNTLGYSWNDSSYNANPQNMTIYPSSEYRWGTKYGSPANPPSEEYDNARLAWAWVRVGVRMNSGTGGKVICWAGCKG